MAYAAQLRQPIEKSLDLCHLKTLRLYTGLFKFQLDHYFTNVARVQSICNGVDRFYLYIGYMMCRCRGTFPSCSSKIVRQLRSFKSNVAKI